LPSGWQRRSGAVLLQALQERDPRAYQLLLSTPPGATFVACTPERLFVRSGRLLASEAVAGTRPRGPPGDLEADFYQGLDLLQSPKDHAEFTLVRDWIRQQLSPLCVELKTGACMCPGPAAKLLQRAMLGCVVNWGGIVTCRHVRS
jgi:isochorismate synthase EntC